MDSFTALVRVVSSVSTLNCWILFRWVSWAGPCSVLGSVGVGGHPIRVDRVDTGTVRWGSCFIASLIITQHDEPLQLQRCSVRVCRGMRGLQSMQQLSRTMALYTGVRLELVFVSSEHYLCHGDSHCGCAAGCGALWAVIHPEYSVTFYRGAAPTPTPAGCCRNCVQASTVQLQLQL